MIDLETWQQFYESDYLNERGMRQYIKMVKTEQEKHKRGPKPHNIAKLGTIKGKNGNTTAFGRMGDDE